MFKELKTLHSGEPACQNRSDSDHLRFVIHHKTDDRFKFDFTIELNGIKSWAVPDVPSMNPLDQRRAEEDRVEAEKILLKSLEQSLTEEVLLTWDKGNYIPIDDNGNVLSEFEALECLKEGALKFFLQGGKLVGEFVLMRKGKNNWLLMKRHDEFALYNTYSYEAVEG
jgi:DNA ligase D-like protein (predicted 3'-phosphoesterase)